MSIDRRARRNVQVVRLIDLAKLIFRPFGHCGSSCLWLPADCRSPPHQLFMELRITSPFQLDL